MSQPASEGLLTYGAKAVSTVSVLVAASTTNLTGPRSPFGILLKVPVTESGTIYVGGDASVTSSNGFPLAAGDSVALPIDDPSKVYVIASTGTISLRYIYL